ncbi:MAG: DUF2339 domain-containing protein [Neorhizobium sp.]|nr:DUF2339 domain-containing protein [Neorhizobium sp.]
MIDLLPLALLVFLLIMQRKMGARVAALEDEVKALRDAIGDRDAAVQAVANSSAGADAAQPWGNEDEDAQAADAGSGPAALPAEASVAAMGHAGEQAQDRLPDATTLARAAPDTDGTDASAADSMARSLAGMRESFESNIGARWPVWVGGVALALGGIFLVRYSIEAGLLGPAARLVLAAGFGLLLLVLGDVLRRRGPSVSASLHTGHALGLPFGRRFGRHAGEIGSAGTEQEPEPEPMADPTAQSNTTQSKTARSGTAQPGRLQSPVAPSNTTQSTITHSASAKSTSTEPGTALPPGIPGVLTAAGALTLIGAIYAAYDVYQFIGPAPAFMLMAAVSLGTVALSLLHGQALAGLGLLGSLATPALVASSDPNISGLFAFLALTFAAVCAASRLRGWTIVPALANLGIGFWSLFYLAVTTDIDPVPPALALIVMIGGTAFLWPGSAYGRDLFDTGDVRTLSGGLHGLLRRPPLKISLTASLMAVLAALGLAASITPGSSVGGLFAAAAVIASLAAYGASRGRAIWAGIIAGFGAVASVALTAADYLDFSLPSVIDGTLSAPAGQAPAAPALIGNTVEIAIFLGLGAVFTLVGLAAIRRYRADDPVFAAAWAFLAPAVPLAIAVISFFNFGHLGRDWSHGLYALAIGLVMLGAAQWLQASAGNPATQSVDEDDASAAGENNPFAAWPAHLAVTGAFSGFAVALHALTSGIVTTILVALLGFAFLISARAKSWPALPWMMPLAILVVFGRIAWDPTLVGATHLGTTPFLNALLPGYGIPAVLAIIAAYLLRHSADLRLKNVLQALAALSSLMAIAILVRHAMNGGTLDTAVPTLAEQSLYTLLAIAFSGVLMTLDAKSPSVTFRYGSMIAGVIATLNVLSLHVFALNPVFTGEGTGAWPLINLLLIGYLLPAIAYGIVAWTARGRRPAIYVAMLGIAGAVLGFLWATLSVRRFFQGPNIDLWKGFGAAETYSYSVVWLLIGVALLALGSRLEARALRLAAAGLVLIAVIKVFLVDMSNLEGILRALSFIGLGAVLIGIGLFYQRILGKKGGSEKTADSAGERP